MKPKFISLLIICGCVILASGCPKVDEAGRKNISGTVTFDGTPLERASVQFSPINTQAPAGSGVIGGTAEVKNGKYELKKDLGLFPGTYRVRITSVIVTDPKTGGPPDPVAYSGAPESFKHEQIIPDKYNTKSELEITVGEDKNQTHDFQLTK